MKHKFQKLKSQSIKMQLRVEMLQVWAKLQVVFDARNIFTANCKLELQ